MFIDEMVVEIWLSKHCGGEFSEKNMEKRLSGAQES